MQRLLDVATAVSTVALALAFTMLGDVILGFPPLMIFAGSVIASLALGGRFAAAVAVILATLCSDFLFVPPRYQWTLNGVVFGLGFCYLSAGLAAATLTRWGRQQSF